MKKKNIIIFIAIVVIGFVIYNGGCNFSTANINDVKMCTSVNDNQCASDNSVFSQGTAEIFVSCHLNNAPNDTDVEFAWFYYGQEKVAIDAVKLNSGDNIGTINLQSSLSRPNNGWPIGEYEIVITILETEKDPIIKKFSVK